MKPDLSVILRNDSLLSVTVSPDHLEAKAEALESSRMVQVVASTKHQEIAVLAMQEIHRLRKLGETSRKLAKEPILSYGREIDRVAKELDLELAEEEMRLSKLTGDWQALEKARIESEQAAQNERLTVLEQQREAELAEAKSLEQREAIHARYSEEARTLAPVTPVVKAEGQGVKDEWCFEVTDALRLVQFHPQFCNIEPKRMEIKEALKSGLTIQGIRAWKETKVSVRG